MIALAPGHLPEAWALRIRTKGAIARAKKLIADGKGDIPDSFPDLAQGLPFSVRATPNVYVSMFDPEGPAVMPKNAAAMGNVPFLWIVGVADPIFLHGRDYAFDPARQKSQEPLCRDSGIASDDAVPGAAHDRRLAEGACNLVACSQRCAT